MDYRVLSRFRSELMGVAMLWVMLFHSFDLKLGNPTLDSIRGAGFGGVDIFILLSSVGLAMSLIRREQDYVSFLKRRAGRILPAYYLVMIPFTLFSIHDPGAPWSALFWNSTLLYYWVRCPGAFNWYICGAMVFYALTPPTLRWLREQHKKGRMLLCAGGVTLASLALCQLLLHEGYACYLDIFYRVPVFVTGLVLGIFILEERKLGWRDWLFWALCGLLWWGYCQLSLAYPSWEQPVILPLAHQFVFSTVPLCLLFCLAFQVLPLGWPRRLLRLVGENSLEIYLLNVTLFSRYDLLRQYVSFGPTNRLYFLLSYAANIALGVLLHKVVEGLRALYQQRKERKLSTPAV